jgi:hypothetical protein
MNARIWHGVVPVEKADRYGRYLSESERGVNDYRRLPGNHGAYLLRRDRGERTEFLLISLWESCDAIERYAGPDIDKAQYFPYDLECLLNPEPRVAHHEVIVAARVAPVTRETAAAEAGRLAGLVAWEPDSIDLRARFLQTFNALFVVPMEENEPLPNDVPGEAIVQAGRLAEEGDGAFLAALMNACLGWYGATAEGGVWLNEALWEILEVQQQLTLTTPGELSPAERSELIDEVYTVPVHDQFEFDAIADGLRSADVPPGLEEDVPRMLATAEALTD